MKILTHIALLMLSTVTYADWPGYRHDASRSAYTDEALPDTLSLHWQYSAMHPPRPAWPRQERMAFDRAFQPIIADGRLFFGSSADDAIRALDTRTGKTLWTYFTEGPVRFAPCFADGVLYVTSDDGYLYALRADDGHLLWKKRGGSEDQKILGNGRMIARTPARGGPVLRDGLVYFAAGIWPSDGISLHALDAKTGETRWLNDSAGSIYMPQPHGGANAESGVSAQGYLAATDERIFMPTGRAVPAAFTRSDGAFDYFHLQRNGRAGGASMMIDDAFFLNDGTVFTRTDGLAVDRFGKGPIAAIQDGFVCASPKGLSVLHWAAVTKKDRKGKERTYRGFESVTNFPAYTEATSIAIAQDHIVLGAKDKVSLIAAETGATLWSNEVSGTVFGIALTSEGIFASTDQGILYHFGAGKDALAITHQAQAWDPKGWPDPVYEHAAEEILKRSGQLEGFCLDTDCGDGSLAYALAQKSSLQIIGVTQDAEAAATARKRLADAGQYGSRITILHRSSPGNNLPDYFADLIVSGTSVKTGITALPPTLNTQRPYGGVICMGKPGEMKISRRGELPGAGQWTHQYANPANTANSDDTIVRGPLSILWFDDPGQQMVQRHGRAPAPLFYEGTIYSEGLDNLYAVDAYNGRTKWTYELPGILKAYDGDHLMGTSGSGSNYCAADECIYVRRGTTCLRIDAKSGKRLDTFDAPDGDDGQPGTWGFIASANQTLYGSLSDTNHVVAYRYLKGGDMSGQLTQSKTLFALYAVDGYLKWRYDAKYSIRHNAIAIASNRVLFVDRPLAESDRVRKGKATPEPRGELHALDAETGEVVWSRDQDVYGTVLAISETHQAVLMSYQPTRFSLASETGGRLSVFDLRDGRLLWEKKADYSTRPMINDRIVYTRDGAWDLLSGEPQPFEFQRSYGCGILAGARNMMVYRSASLGYFDLTRNKRTEDYGGIRPGCWINVIPAGGLVLAPDAAAGCSCSYLNQSWIALQPGGLRAPDIHPPGGGSHTTIDVVLQADDPDKEIVRYTLDGSTPTLDSLRYTQPIRLEKSTHLLARSFNATGRPSPVNDALFAIDPDMLLHEAGHWSAWDAPEAKSAPSEWVLGPGVIEQHSNIYLSDFDTNSDNPGVERPGSFYRFKDGETFTDGTLSFTVNSRDNDAIGIAFRMQDEAHHYLWAMNCERNYRVLTARLGETHTVLAQNDRGFNQQQDYAVEIRLQGSNISIYVDSTLDMETDDATFDRGTIALYTWGNDGSRFSGITFKER